MSSLLKQMQSANISVLKLLWNALSNIRPVMNLKWPFNYINAPCTASLKLISPYVWCMIILFPPATENKKNNIICEDIQFIRWTGLTAVKIYSEIYRKLSIENNFFRSFNVFILSAFNLKYSNNPFCIKNLLK